MGGGGGGGRSERQEGGWGGRRANMLKSFLKIKMHQILAEQTFRKTWCWQLTL